MTKYPQRRNQTSFSVAPGDEAKGRMMGFRPLKSLESQIDEAVAASGMTLAEWLRDAAIAHLKKNPLEPARGEDLEQGHLNGDRGSAEDAIATEPTSTTGDRGQAPASGNTTGGEDQAGDTATKGKGKASPRPRATAHKATRAGSRRAKTSGAG